MKKVSLVLCLPLFFALMSPLAADARSKSSPSSKKPSLSNNSTGRARIADRNVELDINPPEFGPGSTIELVFANPMIPTERVGSVEPDSPIVVEPALAGKFEWTSTRTGLYRLTQAPRFASSYHFRLRAGMKDTAGMEVAPCSLRDVNTELFRIVGQYPTWFGEDISRTPSFLFEFNDAINAEAVVPGMAFKCAQTKERIEVKTRMATGADFTRFHAVPNPTWAEEIAEAKIALEPGAVRDSAVIVEPVSPLNPGKDWVLSITNTIVNRAGSSKLDTGDEIKLGSIKPFIVDEIKPHSPFDAPRYVNIIFNRPLAEEKSTPEEQVKENKSRVADLASFITIEPPAPNTQLIVDGNTLRVSGGFELGKTYHVGVAAEVISADGLKLAAAAETNAAFAANPPYVAVPTYVNAQLATGKGDFSFTAANVTQVHVRAKRLTGPELVKATAAYKNYALHNSRSDDKRATFKPKAFDSFPGSVVFDKTYPFNKPLDQSTLTRLNWHEVLGNTPAAPLFIELEGPAMPGVEGRTSIAQTIVEFTDIGLFQKNDFKTSTVLAVSLKTGKPLANIHVSLASKDGTVLTSGSTDLNGLVGLEGKDPAYVLAEKDGDATVMESSGESSTFIPLWSSNVATAWKSPWDAHRKSFVFSDRPLYKPGETAHVKAYTRSMMGDAMTIEKAPVKAVAELRDPRFRVVLEKPVTFTSTGSWSDDFLLPSGPTGWYHLALKFPKKGAEDENNQDEEASVNLRVDDYKPNTFEAKFDIAGLVLQPDRIKLPLSAHYFMGQPLTRAKVTWNAYRNDEFAAPEAFHDYHFGDAPRWAHYGEDRDPDTAASDEVQLPQWDASGEIVLNEEGKSMIELPAPPPLRGAMPQHVSVQTDITDINEQTISSSTEFIVPGADFVIGLHGPEFFATTGKPVTLEAIAITPAGKPYTQDIKADVKIERQSYHAIKVKTAGGGETTKNQVVLEEQLKQSATLHAQTATNAASVSVPFTPKLAGTYFLTVEARDASGKILLSRQPFYVVGGNEFPWAVEDGASITLQPDKTVFKPGETATIVVKTPIAGTALVSVERNHLHGHFMTAISPDNPVIKVPVMQEDAPNIFVSVLLFRGAEDSPQEVKMPTYKIGYCELTVQSNAHDLAITLKPEHDTVLPSQPVNLTATVADTAGKLLPNAEVTLFAVDEGVLSLMNFKTPDPGAYFHAPQPLAVRNNTSFGDVLTEDEKIRQRGNKGFVVGGGGDDAEASIPARKNFIATALWSASSTTDASGQVKASFTAPDNLSRFRLMAVATEGASQFGHADTGLVIQKPLMIEPAMPRFARLDDELLLKAVLHNTTAQSGEVEVQLTLDDKADFITDLRPFFTAGKEKPEGKVWKRTVTLKAGETSAIAFPVKLTNLGPAKWSWQVKTTKWSDGTALADRMESNFNIEHPLQELRESHYFQLTGKDSPNLLQGVNPMITEGQGTVAVTVSNSELSEVRDALGYVLHYPYGCVEQTTSAMMPWLALGGFNELFPKELDAARSHAALQNGVNRLLAMTTDNGGLSYWPGGNEPSMWATAYGGLALLKARDMGLPVPQAVIDQMLDYMSKQLRELDDEHDPSTLCDAAFALYTLAKGGKAEPAYQNQLFYHRERMPQIGKLYLALAMLVSNSPESEVKTLLAAADGKGSYAPWMGTKVNAALRLIAHTHIGDTAAADADAIALLQSRNGTGDWGNTFTNAWAITALAAHQRSLKDSSAPLKLDLQWDELKQTLDLPSPLAVATTAFALSPAQAQKPLKLAFPADRKAWARVETKGWSNLREFAGENKGYGITRSYAKLLPDGNTQGIDSLHVGDMIIVRLIVETSAADRYLAINDPLPSVFEALNPEFDTDNVHVEAVPEGVEDWFCDHRELRTDRALFFTDNPPAKGKFVLSYLARVSAEGDVIAPSAKIEAMYQPERYGLSATQRIRTLPSVAKTVAGK